MMFTSKGKWLRIIWTGLMNTLRRKSRPKNGIEKMGGADTWLFPRPIDGYAPARDAKKLDLKNLCQPFFLYRLMQVFVGYAMNWTHMSRLPKILNNKRS